jgi:hypothetical protein
MPHGGTADAESASRRVVIAGYTIEDGEALEEAERRLAEILGRPMTADEQAELAAAHERANRLANQHGSDHHGFGHPPPP